MAHLSTAPFDHVLDGLLRMHRLSVEGRFDSPEADALRDEMDAPSLALSVLERKRVAGLSADLNAIEEATPGDILETATRRAFDAAMEDRDWDRALDLLRRHEGGSPLSLLRGRVWSAAGHPEIAAVFLDHAARLTA